MRINLVGRILVVFTPKWLMGDLVGEILLSKWSEGSLVGEILVVFSPKWLRLPVRLTDDAAVPEGTA